MLDDAVCGVIMKLALMLLTRTVRDDYLIDLLLYLIPEAIPWVYSVVE